VRPAAASLLTLEYFEAEPGEMPYQAFDQHHILINLNPNPHRVENWRDGEHRDFTYYENEISVTPAGMKSGWRWHAPSKVIVITAEPQPLEDFAQNELGILLNTAQLKSVPQFIDPDLTAAGVMLRDALNSKMGSAVMFESLARVFLTKLISRYGLEQEEDYAFSKAFTSQHYKRVLDYVAEHFNETITVEELAREAGLSTYYFSRLFKKTIGKSPHQFVMSYRVEQARKQLRQTSDTLVDIAYRCGFSDQAHFTRVFKQHCNLTPRQFRAEQESSF
jgi:AraC family transcriptional regulator